MAPLCLACHLLHCLLTVSVLVNGYRMWSHHAAWVSVSVSVYSKPPVLRATATFAGINSTFPETPSLPATKPVSATGDVAGEMSSFGLTGIHRRWGVAIQRSWESQTPRHHGSVTDGFGPWTWQWPPFSESPLELRPRKSPTSSSCGFASWKLAYARHGVTPGRSVTKLVFSIRSSPHGIWTCFF